MVRVVIGIIKKHLDISLEARNQMDAMLTDIPNYDVLAEYPDFYQLRRLAVELVKIIKKTDISKLVKIPGQVETKEFLKSCMPIDVDEQFLDWHARQMRLWMSGVEEMRKRSRRDSVPLR